MTTTTVASVAQALFDALPSDHSRRAYEGAWRRFLAWLSGEGVDVLEVRPRHVEGYVSAMRSEGKAKATIHHSLAVVRETYSALVRHELLDVNPAREAKVPRMVAKPNTPWLTEEELTTLLDAPSSETFEGKRDRLILRLYAGLGWRRSEVTQLTVENFRSKASTVEGVVGKGGKEIKVGVPQWLQAEIAAWCRYAGIESGPILIKSLENRKPITAQTAYKRVKAAGALVNLPEERVTCHALRRTFATLLDKRGVGVREVQGALNHSSVTTTERYQKESRGERHAPGEILGDLATERKGK